MNEVIERSRGEAAVLDSLSQEAQYYAKSVVANTIQLGRVLTEAKKLVKHGEWESWVRTNAGCSMRNAQMFMATYARFGENSDIAKLTDRSKVFAMLSLPPGAEEEFLAGNDVSGMSVREVKEAVKEYSNPSKEPEGTPDDDAAGISDVATNEIMRLKAEVERLGQTNLDMVTQLNQQRTNETKLRHELTEQIEMTKELQDAYDALRMGGAGVYGTFTDIPEPEPEAFTYTTLAAAVGRFVGECAVMPAMHHTFAGMPQSTRNLYEEQLSTVERWLRDARSALNAIACEEV